MDFSQIKLRNGCYTKLCTSATFCISDVQEEEVEVEEQQCNEDGNILGNPSHNPDNI